MRKHHDTVRNGQVVRHGDVACGRVRAVQREREKTRLRRGARKHARHRVKRHAFRQRARERRHDRWCASNDHRPLNVRHIDFAVLQVVYQADLACGVKSGHLRANVVAHDHDGRKVHVYAVDVLDPNAMEIVRADVVGLGLAGFLIDRAHVLVEVIANRDDLITVRQLLRGVLHLAVGTAIDLVELRLHQLPLNLNLVRFTVLPVRVVRVVRIVRNEVAQLHLVVVVALRRRHLHPHRIAELKHRRCGRGRRQLDDWLHLRGKVVDRRVIHEGRRRDVHDTAACQVSGAIVKQPEIADGPRDAVKAHPEVFTTKIHSRIGELVAIGGVDGARRHRRVGCPRTVRVLLALILHAHHGVQRVRVVLRDRWRTVVVPVVRVRDVPTANVFYLNLEPVTRLPGIVHRVEVIETAIGDTGLHRG